MSRPLGAAGRLAAAFVDSRLTPLVVVASIALGGLAVLTLPREEEPQIVVPMVDVFVDLPGATPAEVEQQVTRPIEAALADVAGIEYLYSTSSPGQALVIARFAVGQDADRALARVNRQIAVAAERLPRAATVPRVHARSIDDVPMFAVTLWSPRYDDVALRGLAAQVRESIADIPDVSAVSIIGGRTRVVAVQLDPARLAAYDVTATAVRQAIAAADVRAVTTGPITAAAAVVLEAGTRLTTAADVRAVVVATRQERPVRLGDVATIADQDDEPDSYVRYWSRAGGARPAVTVAVAKKPGSNAIAVARAVEARLERLRGTLVPADVTLAITRDYGETAAEKSNELLWHMALAVLSVSLLIWAVLGRREALVVLVAIPVTLALTLFTFSLYGYTLNRITLFALIFSIGILVDDAIVVVENLVRHARDAAPGDRSQFVAVALRAVDEVGNPTILATLTVVAAILPMAFVGGLMGPYMRPIPVGASAAMVFSLMVAFVVTPWAAVRLLVPGGHADESREGRMTLAYRRVMSRILASGRSRLTFVGVLILLLGAAAVLVPTGLVTVKMLPFDNKGEFQVIVDMPEGTPLEATARVTAALAAAALEDPAVVDVQDYVGTAAPYSFNGLVRHYFLRRAPHLADLQVNLVSRGQRREQSHAIAGRVRQRLAPIARRFGATIQVAEVPPGPPVLQTLVAEIYGPDAGRRRALAADVKALFERTPGVVDVDWYVESERPRLRLVVDTERASAAGVSPADVAALVRMAGSGDQAGLLHDADARDAVPIVVRLPRERLGSLDGVRSLRVGAVSPVAVAEVTHLDTGTEDRSIYHKNLQPVTYVTADLAGSGESPVYAIERMNASLAEVRLPEGYAFEVFNARQPPTILVATR